MYFKGLDFLRIGFIFLMVALIVSMVLFWKNIVAVIVVGCTLLFMSYKGFMYLRGIVKR